MSCSQCGGERIASVNSKASDLHYWSYKNIEHDGYLPDCSGIGGGDCVDFSYCLDCGQIQNWTPVTDEDIQNDEEFEGMDLTVVPEDTEALENQFLELTAQILEAGNFESLSEANWDLWCECIKSLENKGLLPKGVIDPRKITIPKLRELMEGKT